MGGICHRRLNVAMNGKENVEYSLLPEGMGYHYEAIEVMKCLDEGKLESDIVPHSFTRDLMETLDRIRAGSGDNVSGQRLGEGRRGD